MKELIENLRAVAGKAQFASFTYTTKTKQNKAGVVIDGGEVARYVLVLGAKYLNLLEKSLLGAQLLTQQELNTIFGESNLSIDDINKFINIPLQMNEARGEVIKSLEKSLAAHKAGTQSEDYTKKDQYIPLGGGLNLNQTDSSLQMFGLVQSKTILKKGVYKVVDSAPLTIAKNLIRKSLPIGKFREFALDLGNIHSVKLNGNVLIIGDGPDLAEKYNSIEIKLPEKALDMV